MSTQSVSVSSGLGLGNLIAFYVSAFVVHNSLGWIILHSLFGWLYVAYYFLTQ